MDEKDHRVGGMVPGAAAAEELVDDGSDERSAAAPPRGGEVITDQLEEIRKSAQE